jgi:hypothetical protein
MTVPGLTGPSGRKPNRRASAKARVDHEGSPTLKVTISSAETISMCRLPIGEVLARVHVVDLLDELQRRLRTDEFPVFCDWLENRGDALGPALSIFTEQLATLRRERKPPNTDKAGFAGDQATLDPGSVPATLEQPSNRLPF